MLLHSHIWGSWLSLGLLLLVVEARSQTATLSGFVMDATTLQPLPYAHVVKNQHLGTRPDQSGRFTVTVNHLDTITVSHVSFRSYSVIIQLIPGQDTMSMAVFLENEIRQLPTLLVTPYPITLNDFKAKLLEIEVTQPASNMLQQQQRITFDMILGPKVSYDAYENYRGINQPEGFTLFSSGPNKGIKRALKSLGIGRKNKKH